jgi:serine/threonine protein kinase
MSENGKYQRFGRYLILDHLVDGGMAKICRARFLGEQADKVVAIKMVQPQFSKDPNFKTMFMDEIKVAFGLLHPNIAQTYDYGLYQEQLYTAMEYIDGCNLKQVLDRLKEKNFAFPVEISTYIVSQVCQGLHYAHTFTDKLSGKPLNLVHRDISPHNIMMTYDGAVKVIDFGIAKAETNSEATQAGTIKGKLSYLAPEYLEGLSLDHRYDQFAVGITLWELLTCRKLFTAANDLAVLKQIQACKIAPPSTFNPNVKPELDRIVLKALSKDRNNRYENMDKFNRDLVKFLYANYPDFNSSDLSYFAKELFKEEIKRDKAKFLDYGKIDVKPYLEELTREASGQGGATPAQAAVAGQGLESGPQVKRELDFDFNKDGNASGTIALDLPANRAKKQASKTDATKTTANPMLKKTGGTQIINKNKITASGTQTKTKLNASDLEEKKKGGAVPVIILVAALAVVAYLNPELVKEYTGIEIGGSEEVSRDIASEDHHEVAKEAPAPKKAEGILTISGIDPYMELYINDQKVSYSGLGVKIPLNQEVNVRIEKENHAGFSAKVKVDRENPNTSISVPELERLRFGLLSSSNNYTEGSTLKVTVNGSEVEHKLPIQDLRMPAGKYDGVIKDPLLGTEKPVTFEIEENMKHSLE